VAGLTRGMSGAHLANVMNEAALLAARRHTTTVSGLLVDEAIERVGMGISRAHKLSDADRRRVAYHEAGHALAALSLPGGGVLPHKLTILPRGKTLGAFWHTELDEDAQVSRPGLIDRMAMLLSGRVAEQSVFGEAGAGASEDLSRVADIARRMVCEMGMSEALGATSYPESTPNGYSEETARLIDSETRKLVTEAEERSRDTLQGMRATLDRVAEALIEHETLTSEAFRALVDEGSDARPAEGAARVG